MKLIAIFGAVVAVAACEPGAGGGDAETSGSTGTDGTSSTDGVDGTTVTDGVDGTDGVNTDTYPVIEIQDDPNNPTLSPGCDPGGGIESPGADIDAAELRKGGSGGGVYLTGCVFSGAGTCENDNTNPADAEGAPNATGEELNAYVSLSGGMLRCSWDGSAIAATGDVLNVVEVGAQASPSATTENYTVRFCKDTAGNCTKESNKASGEATFAFDDLF